MNSTSSPDSRSAQPQKMCKACFAVIHPQAEICPQCGVRQFHPINKAALLLLTFFLGGIGAHKFYVGKNLQGVFYLLFFWTGIPGIIALVEFLIYIFTDTDQLQRMYSESHGGATAVACVVGAVGLVFVMGILAAIAIPAFVSYRGKAACRMVENEAQRASVAVSEYFLDTGNTQAPSIAELTETVGYAPQAKVQIEVRGNTQRYSIIAADKSGRCKDGSIYRMIQPNDQGRNGWQ